VVRAEGGIFLPAGKTKTKQNRRVPISSILRVILDKRRNDPAGQPLPDAYVFGDEIGRKRASLNDAWKGARRRAKADGLHFHDLRREAGSRWMDAGVPLGVIQRWLGYANVSQTSTYLGASLDDGASAMQAFEQRIGRVPNIVTQSDDSASTTRRKRTRSDRPVFKKTNKNGTRPDPAIVLH
jgi:integrase